MRITDGLSDSIFYEMLSSLSFLLDRKRCWHLALTLSSLSCCVDLLLTPHFALKSVHTLVLYGAQVSINDLIIVHDVGDIVLPAKGLCALV